MNIVQSVGAPISGQGGSLAFLSQDHEFAPSLRWDFYTIRSPCPRLPYRLICVRMLKLMAASSPGRSDHRPANEVDRSCSGMFGTNPLSSEQHCGCDVPSQHRVRVALSSLKQSITIIFPAHCCPADSRFLKRESLLSSRHICHACRKCLC